MSNISSTYHFTSSTNASLKRDALWNIIEPGDPYDIRKSMIAKVPGDKKNFMGDHLELVCLFQAAEIERLCEFLEDFRQKYILNYSQRHREIQRLHLDRHSYEIQIKQLNHRLAEENSFREENEKLKQFLKNQNNNRVEVEDSIRIKYEKLLLQFKAFEEENLRIRRENQNMLLQISSFDAKFEALRKSKQTEIDELHLRWSQQSSMTSQIEIQSLRSQYESEIQRLDLQNKRIQQLNEEKLRQIDSWHEKYRSLEQQMNRSSENRNDLIKYERQIAEYENRFVIFGQEIDRLNLVVKEITVKYDLSEQKSKDLENRLATVNREYTLLQTKSTSTVHEVSEYTRRIAQLETENKRLLESGRYSQEVESKLRLSNQEISRLTAQLRLESENTLRLKSELQKFQYEGSRVNILEKQLFEYKQTASENNSLKERLARSENQVGVLKQEIDRLKEELSKKGGLDINFQHLQAEYERLQRSSEEQSKKIQITIQEYETRIVQTRQEYEHRIEVITKTHGSEFESKALMLQNEVQRLGDILKQRNEEVSVLQRQLREVQSTVSQSEYEVQRKIQAYESNIQTLRRENEQAVRRIRELEPLQRKVSESENKALITAQELERVNHQLRQKEVDIDNLRRQIREQEISIVQKFEMDTSRKIGSYEQSLNGLSREYEELKRRYSELENKSALLSLEIERLMTKINENQQKINHYEQENQRLQKFVKQTEVNIKSRYEFEVNQKVANYETALRNNQVENDGLKRRVMDLENGNESAKRRIHQLESIIETLKRRVAELQNSSKKLIEYENTLQNLSREFERVSGALRQKHEEHTALENNYRNLARQAEETNRKYVEIQTTIKNKYEVEVTRTVTTLEQNIANFTRENTELKRYLQQYEGKLQLQHTENEKLAINFRNLNQENEQLKRQLREFENMFNQKMEVEVTNKYRSYESTIETMKRDLDNYLRENAELKRVLQLSEQSSLKLKQDYEELRRKHQQDSGDVSKRISEYELAIKKLHSENEGLKRTLVEYENSIRQFEAEAGRKISTLDQNLGGVARENDELKRRLEQNIRESDEMRKFIQTLEKDRDELGRRLREASEFNKKIPEYENAMNSLRQEHERTTVLLRTKTEEFGKAQEYINELTQKFNAQERNIAQSQTTIQQFESSVKTQITQYQQNITIITQENAEIKRKLNECHGKIAEYENKIVIMNQELERLNLNIRNQVEKSNQLENNFRVSAHQNEDLKRKIVELQNTITQRYEVEAARNIKNLEQAIEHLQKENHQLKGYVTSYEQKTNGLSIELEKYGSNIRALTEENNLLKNQLRETEIQFTRRYETEVTAKYSAYEREITNFQRENEELIRKLKEYGERVVPEYENKIAILRQEIERLKHQLSQESGQLGNNLKIVSQENQELKRQLQELHGLKQRHDMDTQQQFGVLQQNLAHLQKENEELKKYIKQMGGQYQGLGQNFTHVQKENEDNKRRVAEAQHEIERLIKKLNELSQENENVRRQSKETEMQIIQRFQSESTQQINIYKQEINQLQVQWKNSQQQVEELQRRFNEVGTDASRKVTQLSSEIQKLHLTIRELQSKLAHSHQQNQAIHKRMKENQIQLNQKWQMQYRNKINLYEQNIQSINKTVQQREREIYENNNRRVAELEQRVALMGQELQRVNGTLKGRNEEIERMRQEIERLNNALRLKLEETKQYEIETNKFRSVTQTQFTKLQESYSLIVRDNQNYKKNLFQYQNRIKKVYGQFQRLQNIINEYKTQRETIFQKNNGLVREIERLIGVNQELEKNVQEVNLKLSDQAALEKRIKEDLAMMVVLFAEIESLRKRIKDKEREVEDVRRSSIAPFKLDASNINNNRVRNSSL